MENISPSIIEAWNTYGRIAAYLVVGAGLVYFLIHLFKLMTIKDFKTKYDYINQNEINVLWVSSLLIIIGVAIYSNTLVEKTAYLWFIIRIFMSTAFAIIAGIIVQNIIKFYYPFYIEKRLKKLRYTPRISPDGRKMKLLSEEEEDVYLDEGMQAEEDAYSVDYDVWIDEVSGFTKIEKYNGRLHALQCPECNYQTLKVVREEIIQSPTTTEEGELMKYFECGYCGHKERKSFKVAKVESEVDSQQN